MDIRIRGRVNVTVWSIAYFRVCLKSCEILLNNPLTESSAAMSFNLVVSGIQFFPTCR